MVLEQAVVFNEALNMMNSCPEKRVEDMVLRQMAQLQPILILAILQEKYSELYAPLKKICETRIGIVSQCLVPPSNLNDQYLTNVALKINLKFGGYNILLSDEEEKTLPKVSEVPTFILGLSVSHPEDPRLKSSIAAIRNPAVASMEWPKYTTRVRTKSPKQVMIEGLYEEVAGKKGGMVMELMKQFISTSRGPNLPRRKHYDPI